jgi:uncharacterized protein YbcV (DUF1398 family)
MFTIAEIKAAYSKVKSGTDFPGYVKDIKALGVKSYVTYVSDSHTVYYNAGNSSVQTEAKYAALSIAGQSNVEQFMERLKLHQHGKTDYLTFCNDSAAAGVEKWVVDTDDMTCIYYDMAGNKILVEQVPAV